FAACLLGYAGAYPLRAHSIRVPSTHFRSRPPAEALTPTGSPKVEARLASGSCHLGQASCMLSLHQDLPGSWLHPARGGSAMDNLRRKLRAVGEAAEQAREFEADGGERLSAAERVSAYSAREDGPLPVEDTTGAAEPAGEE